MGEEGGDEASLLRASRWVDRCREGGTRGVEPTDDSPEDHSKREEEGEGADQ